jgi:phosphatidate phosphatase
MVLSHNTRKMICLMTIDLVCILLVGIPCLLLWLIGDPFFRGFFCDDETIRHPYRDSTLPTWALVVVSYSLPGIIFCLVETSRLKRSATFTWPRFHRDLYGVLGIFVFGSLVNQLLTDTSKYTIGRLRPHFMAVCNPNVTLSSVAVCGNSSGPVYVTEYTCLGEEGVEETERLDRLHDARLSFVSGHASLSAYSMWFCILYLQVGCVLFAFFTSLTRISDYKHHPEDVVCGAILGFAVATLAHTFLVSSCLMEA